MGSANLNPNLFRSSVERLATRDGYGQALVRAGEKNKQIVALTADVAESVRLDGFKAKFPSRFFEVGVAEQNLMGVAAGLAREGKIPFVSSYAVFSPGRNWEQLRVSVCYNHVPVKIASTHAGLTVGADGATHQALEDLALTRVLPGLTVVVPCDFEEAKKATLAAIDRPGPVYLRLTRDKSPLMTSKKTPFKIGRAEIFKSGKDVTIVACGPLLYETLLAAKELATEHIHAEVINNHSLKPLDQKTLLASLKKTGCLVSVEEHQIIGGLESALAELTARYLPVPMEMVGVEDRFGESGPPQALLEKYRLTAPWIKKAALKALQRKTYARK